MLEERSQALKERGDAATERAQNLATEVKELSEKLLASENLRQQLEDLIEELRLVKQAKVHLPTTHCSGNTLSFSDRIPKKPDPSQDSGKLAFLHVNQEFIKRFLLSFHACALSWGFLRKHPVYKSVTHAAGSASRSVRQGFGACKQSAAAVQEGLGAARSGANGHQELR